MNELIDCFDPSLQAVFSERSCKAALNYRQDSRHLFYALMHISEHFDVRPLAHQYLKQHLLDANKHFESKFSRQYQPDKIDSLLQAPITIPQPGFTGLNDHVRQCSAIILTEPCWLQTVSQAATSQSPMAVKLMAVYLAIIRDESYMELNRALLCDLAAMHTWAFAEQATIGDSIFDFAVLQLALACFPRVFFPELLGFTLAYCQKPAQTDYFIAADEKPDSASLTDFFTIRKNLAASQSSKIIEVIQDYVLLFADQADVIWLRIQSGFWLYQEHNQRCYPDQQRQSAVSPQQAIVELLQNKATSAIGHHSKIQLAGRSLDNWFAQKPFDSKNFLRALRQSSYVDDRTPLNSPLLKLFDFNGPMFGVLNEAEKEIVKNWVCAEPDQSDSDFGSVNINSPEIKALKVNGTTFPSINFSRLNNRELYYYLVNADLYPDVLTTAKKKVQSMFRLSKCCSRMPFKHYTHQAFEDYISRLYQNEVKAYKPLEGSPKLTKKTYCWGIEQFAPTILTDGCWLQNINHYNTGTHRAISELLSSIYSDETGNGIHAQNHPFIYQQLLDSLDIRLPPIYSRAFINHPGFISSAFDLPVYLMAISKFSSSFLPELLGLNMAIELSGLGNVYLRLAEELKFWGINPAIVTVHISIDNVGSGHAALAKRAIQLYLDEMLACYGERDMQRHWRRIYTGYCSLQLASTRFKFALLAHYLLKRARALYPVSSTPS